MKNYTLIFLATITMIGMLTISGCERSNKYIVTFNANGGSGIMEQQIFTEGEQQALKSNTFSRDGYTFYGWTGNDANYIDGQIISIDDNLTLYAQWIPNNYQGSIENPIPTGRINEHDYVDLGLPSGNLWATCNVGANNPEGDGNQYAWGETIPNEGSILYPLADNQDAFTVNATLPANADAATVNWGSGWETPTKTDFEELVNYCTITYTNLNNKSGCLFTGQNGNSIFIPAPATTRYWSSTYWDVQEAYCFKIELLYTDCFPIYYSKKASVRPIFHVENPSNPIVATSIASNVSFTSATLNGIIANNSAETITECGFVYGTNLENLLQNVSSSVSNNTFSYTISGLSPYTTYYYKAYATNNNGTAYGEVLSFITGSSGQINGHEWVCLGLPSGTLWATCNVGATNPEDYGDFFAWGETAPKETYNWDTYIYHYDSGGLTKYCSAANYGYNDFTDGLTTLEAEDDAATANWGSVWRMPTSAELYELKTYCTLRKTTKNGVNGHLFTGPNGNSIFLPNASMTDNPNDASTYGYYWSSSLYSNFPEQSNAFMLYNGSSGVTYLYRFMGLSVRPVFSPITE
jgi:uncharacterized repeat protein (TIGR02543 family)